MIDRGRFLGHVLAVAASVSFALGTGLAVYTYTYGTTPLSVTTVRTTFTLVVLFLIIRLTGGTLALPRKDRWLSIAIGIAVAAQSISHYIAVQMLPLAHATLLFYLYPFFIAFAAHFSRLERITFPVIAAMLVAFAGLVLVLDLGSAESAVLSVPGIALAVCAAISFTVVALMSQPIIGRAEDSRAVTLHLHMTPVAAFLIASIALDDFAMPTTTDAWIALGFVPVFYCFAVIAIFYAIGTIGSVRMSLIMNLEPVVAIALGFVLLSQNLAPVQLLGAALVIGAVVAVRWIPAQRAAQER